MLTGASARMLKGLLRVVRWHTRRLGIGLAMALCASLWGGAAIMAQTRPSAVPPAPAATTAVRPLTAEWIQSQIDELTANTSLDAATRDQAIAFYKTALSRLEAVQASEIAATSFREAIDTAPGELAALQAQQATSAATNGSAAADPSVPSFDDMPLADLELRLTKQKLEATSARKALSDIEEGLRAMQARPAAARTEIQDENKQIADIDKSLATPAPANEAGAVTAARQVSLRARRLASSKHVETLEQELVSLQSRQDLLAARRDRASADATRIDKELDAIQKVLNAKRQQEAQNQLAQAEQTRREVARQHPLFAEYAKQNAELSETWSTLDRRISKATRTQASVKAQQDQLAENEQSARQLLDIGAVGEEYGVFLRELRARLPDTERVMEDVDDRERTIIEARLKRLRVQDQERLLIDVDAAVDRIIAQNPAVAAVPDGIDQLRPTLTELVIARKKTLALLANGYSQLIKMLTDINADARELSTDNAELDTLLKERLLWLPSTSSAGSAWWADVVASVRWLTTWSSWTATGNAAALRLKAFPFATALVIIVFFGLLLLRRRLRRRLTAIAGLLNRVSTDRFSATVEALGLTLLLTVPWPLLFGFIGGLVSTEREASAFSAAVGRGFIGAAIVVLILRTFLTMCRRDGLFMAHFQWGERTCIRLGRELRWLMHIEALAAFVVSASTASEEPIYSNGIGRLAFMIGSLGLALFMYRVLHPRRGPAAAFVAASRMLWRFRHFWFPLAVAIPAGLGALAALGYYETAAQIQSRVFTTAWVGLVGLIVYAMAIRWLLVVQRRLAYRQALERRDKARAAKAKEATETAGESIMPPVEEPEVDISAVSSQTRTLLRWAVGMSVGFAFWFIWSKMFPTIRVLDDVTLWTHAVTGPQGDSIVPVTAWDIVMALLVTIATAVGAKNLPGLIEIALLQRLAVPSGTRYTVATVTRYIIVSVGLLLAVNMLGADWSKMQWIAAALGVGLGFGLQEIVANFVSGLIILFEQPVRVGDLVTVGDRIGVVSRIRIRATTIIDPDNREVIIPNKAFITERVTNWALNDPVTRIVILVGIAYGSDTIKAHRVLMETAKANPMVLDAPAPMVLFMGFGDSALNFEVRVYVREIANRIPLTHEMHMAIHAALRDAGIEIPFPQRDIHVRTAEALTPIMPAAAIDPKQKP